MAVVLRNLPTYGRVLCPSGAATRVWCGIEPSKLPKRNASPFQEQESPFLKSNNSVSFSQSADNLARCQASAAAHPLRSRQSIGILERPMMQEKLTPELLPDTIDQHASPLPRSVLAESVQGNLVECSGKGSRPLYTNVLLEFQMSYTDTIPKEMRSQVDNAAVRMAFEVALKNAPGNAQIISDYASFTWKSLGDVDVAEELFNRALELAPFDANIQASHALFLWQCDE